MAPCYSDSWVVIVIKFCLLVWSVEAKKEGKKSDTEKAKDAAPKDKKIDKKKAEKKNVGAFIYTVTQ